MYTAGVDPQRPRYFPDEADVPGAVPFTPGFGSTPPCLVGRDELIRTVCASLAGDPASEGATNVLLAPRGLGKTVVLNEIEDAARAERGWLVVSVSGTDGDPIAETHKEVCRVMEAWNDAHGEPIRRQVSGVSIGVGGVSAGISVAQEPEPRRTRYGDDLRRDLSELASAAAQTGSRVLLTMDEMHAIPLAKARQLGSYIQHIAKRERRALVFVGAALPYITETLLADRKSTFLQRLVIHRVGPLSEAQARRGLQEPISDHGGLIEPEALDIAAAAAGGHPYMLQLVGDKMWRAAGGPGHIITAEHAQSAAAQAEESLEDHLFAPTWQSLSATDKRFAAAMATLSHTDRMPRVADICQTAGISQTSASAYRRRLLLSGFVSPGDRGRLKFAHPAIAPWLLRTAATDRATIPKTSASTGHDQTEHSR